MSDHLKTTLNLLATTENEASVRVLLAALDSRWRPIRDQALVAILTRRSPAGHREVIRRLHLLDESNRTAIRQSRGRMNHALRDALLSTEERMCRNGCEIVLWFGEHDLIPTLLSALADPANPNRPVLGTTLLELTEALYAECAASGEVTKGFRDPELVRASTLTALESSVERFVQHRRREPIEAFLVLADRQNPALRQILGDPYHPAFLAMLDVLSKSPRPGVMQLLLSCLDDPTVSSAILSVLGKRADADFVPLLMKQIGRAPSEVVVKNLKRIVAISWLANPPAVLVGLDGPGQAAAVRFVVHSSVSRRQAFAVVRHLLIYGKREGRRAAAAALTEFSGVEANDLAVRALDDDDPIVQAEVIPRLRGRGIPGVLARLLELSESPHENVRKAIRQSLDEYSFDRFVMIFDVLDEEVRKQTGQLVRRIDPLALPRLRKELRSELRTRRLRALKMLRALDAQEEFEPDVIRMLRSDPDHMVRVEAIDLLSESTSNAARHALRRALSDQSMAVHEAARRALDELTHKHH